MTGVESFAEPILHFIRAGGFLFGCLWFVRRFFSPLSILCLTLALAVPALELKLAASSSLTFVSCAREAITGALFGLGVSLPAGIAYLGGRWLGMLAVPGQPGDFFSVPVRTKRMIEAAFVLLICVLFTGNQLFMRALSAVISAGHAAPLSAETLTSFREFLSAFGGAAWSAAFMLCLPAFVAGVGVVALAAFANRFLSPIPGSLVRGIRAPLCIFLAGLAAYSLESATLPAAEQTLEKFMGLIR